MTIQQAKENEVILQINNREEYEKAILEMNKIYSGWYKSKFKEYTSKGLPFYIDVKWDMIRKGELSDLHGTPQPVSILDDCEINNNYSIY